MLLPTPSRVRLLRHTYETIRRSDPGEQAPIEEQHRYWRLHDAAKREYAVADWRWESLVLRLLIVIAAVASAGSLLFTGLTVVALVVCVAAFWRTYVILTRHAPD